MIAAHRLGRRAAVATALAALLIVANALPATSGASFSRDASGAASFEAAADFGPIPVSGLMWWLDSSEGSTMFTDAACSTAASIGDEVKCWQDVRPGGAAVTTASSGPVWNPTALNGLHPLRFTQYQLLAGPDLLGGSASDLYVAAVLRENASSNIDFIISLNGSVTDVNTRTSLLSAANLDRAWNFDAGSAWERATVPAGATSVGDVTLLSMWKDSDADENGIRLDRGTTYLSSTSNPATTSGGLTLGTLDWGSLVENKDIAELLIYDRMPTPTEQAQVQDYLQTKWATP